MVGRTGRRVGLAFKRPDLLWRALTNREVGAIGLEEILPFLPAEPVILEAGAFDGTDTVRLAESIPGCIVHAFEPIPSSYSVLTEKVASFKNVVCHPLALSDASGNADMWVSASADGSWRPDSSSILEPREHIAAFPSVSFDDKVSVRVTTVDEWAREEGLDRIDFMWLDLQGAEENALVGAKEILKSTSVVLAEVSRVRLYNNRLLYKDFLSFMADMSFAPVIDRVAVDFGNILFERLGRTE